MEVINNLDLNKVVTVSAESANQEGSAVGIGPGGKYTIRDLLHGLLLQSGNDAAHALAQELGGNEQALARVNALAHNLGATDTYAASYSGLDAPGMSTSARDMAIFTIMRGRIPRSPRLWARMNISSLAIRIIRGGQLGMIMGCS